MIEKKVITTTTYKILEEKDVEEIMSKYVGREVKINEIDFILMDIVCFENYSFNYKDIEECDYGIGCETYIDGKEIIDSETEFSPLDKFMPNTLYAKLKDIFAFDVSKFKSFIDIHITTGNLYSKI